MLNLTTSSVTRVLGSRLFLALAVIASPSMTVADRSAAADGVGTEASVVAVEVPPMVESPLANTMESAAATASVFEVEGWQDADLGGINREVFAVALRAAWAAADHGNASNTRTLTVIDFSRPSPEKRLWVYDLRSRTLLFEEVVSHGRGSGVAMATAFSNIPESNQSSLGLFRTAETYVGKHGYSLRLDGLEPGVNDRARDRAIVMHAAEYVNPAAAAKNGYLGRSLGCPALRPEISRQLIDAVKEGGLLFAYYPDQQWLNSSTFLAD